MAQLGRDTFLMSLLIPGSTGGEKCDLFAVTVIERHHVFDGSFSWASSGLTFYSRRSISVSKNARQNKTTLRQNDSELVKFKALILSEGGFSFFL